MTVEFWKGRKVLITGGSGFIGSNLAARLVALGSSVRVADNLERGRLEFLQSVLDRIEFLQLDLRDCSSCQRACAAQDVVFHLASKVGGISYYLEQPGKVMAQNLLLDINMWQAAQRAGVQFYLYTSSAHVYPRGLQGSPDSSLLREEDAYPADPELSYGWAKLMGERLIEYQVAEGSPLRAAIVRLIGVYGPHQDVDLATGSALPVFIRRAIEYPRTPFVVFSSGRETRSYCYVDDVVEAMLRCVEKTQLQPVVGPLNIGREERATIGELAETIVAISGKDIKIQYDASRPTVIWGQTLDCSKARKLLERWQPKIPLAEGLRRTYADIASRLAAKGLQRQSTAGHFPCQPS